MTSNCMTLDYHKDGLSQLDMKSTLIYNIISENCK